MANKFQYAFCIDTAKCSGCKACQVACKDRNNGDENLPALNLRRVYEYCGGTVNVNPSTNTMESNVFAYYTSIGCNQCDSPSCVKAACPTGAHYKRSDGFVLIDESICIGCGSCAVACPYDAPQLDSSTAIMRKCDGCNDRIAKGLKPSCVDACQLDALDFDTIENIKEKYPNAVSANYAPLPSSSVTQPNLFIVPNRNAQPSGSLSGKVTNEREV